MYKFVVEDKTVIGTDNMGTKHITVELMIEKDTDGEVKPVYAIDSSWDGLNTIPELT